MARALTQLGLVPHAQGVEFHGVSRGFEVVARVVSSGLFGVGRGLEVCVRGGSRAVGDVGATIPAALWINCPSPFLGPVVVGDDPFDAELAVFGDELVVVALMTASTRSLLFTSCRAWSLAVKAREVELVLGSCDPNTVEDAISAAVELADALSIQPKDVAHRLLENAVRDRLAPVRLRNLQLLLAHFPWTAEAMHASEAAIADPHPELRILGAISLGVKGLPTLLALLEHSRWPHSIRERALERLSRLAGELEPAARADLHAKISEVLETMFTVERDEPRTMALLALDRMGKRPDALRIVSAAREADAGSATQMLGTLRFTVDRIAEEELAGMALLSGPKLGSAALEALGRVGTVAIVPALRRLVEIGDTEVRREARRAIARIQAQVDRDAPGLLEIATEEPSGQLSQTDEAGALSPLDE